MSELKRCPFCGGEAEIVGSAYKRILCKGCEIEIFITEETVKKWNMRKPMQNIVERLEEVSFPDIDENYADDGQQMLFLHDAIEIVREEGGLNE